jgi:hypothetical protein
MRQNTLLIGPAPFLDMTPYNRDLKEPFYDDRKLPQMSFSDSVTFESIGFLTLDELVSNLKHRIPTSTRPCSVLRKARLEPSRGEKAYKPNYCGRIETLLDEGVLALALSLFLDCRKVSCQNPSPRRQYVFLF